MTTVKRGQRFKGVDLVRSRPSPYGGNTRYPSPKGTVTPDAEAEDDAGSCYWCGFPLLDMSIANCPHCDSDNVRGIRHMPDQNTPGI